MARIGSAMGDDEHRMSEAVVPDGILIGETRDSRSEFIGFVALSLSVEVLPRESSGRSRFFVRQRRDLTSTRVVGIGGTASTTSFWDYLFRCDVQIWSTDGRVATQLEPIGRFP